MANQPYSSFKEYLELFWIKFTVQVRSFFNFLHVAIRYYPNNLTFARCDLSLLFLYFADNPFTISKRFLTKKNEENVYAYGETPLTTLENIAKECQITAEDVVYELGCGRGRTCFWLNAFMGCKVVGIEYVPEFVEYANKIKTRFAIDGIEFRHQDFMKADLTGATVVYLYGTCLEDDCIESLIQKFKKLPPGTKIITVSYPLNEYTQEPHFEVMKHFTADYPWGDADVYLQLRK